MNWLIWYYGGGGRVYTEYSRDTKWANLPWEGQESPYRERDPCTGIEELKEHQRKVTSGQTDIENWKAEENLVLDIQVW